MKKVNKYYLLIILWLSVSYLAQSRNMAKDTLDDIALILKRDENKIVLRWAPMSYSLWLNWKNARITVYKKEWSAGGFNPKIKPVLISDTIKVWTKEKYESYVTAHEPDSLVALCGYAIYSPYESIAKGQKPDLNNLADRQKEMQNRFMAVLFAAERSTIAAQSLAMQFEDNDVHINKRIAYTVRVSLPSGKQLSKTIVYDPDDYQEFIPVIKRGIEGENHITLIWDRKKHEKHYSAYWIERSEDGQHFQRLNKLPYIHGTDSKNQKLQGDISYTDSVANYRPFYYRIIGLDAFAGESKPSVPVKLMGRDKTPPPTPSGLKAYMPNEKYMKITWNYDNPTPDLTGFIVKKSYRHDGGFTLSSPILGKDIFEYHDPAPDYFGKNYYEVCAVDTAGNEACSPPIYGLINDTIPPSKPTGLTGSIDSSGIVTLKWSKGPERDIAGYQVYFSNKSDGLFSKITDYPIQDTVFTDTITLHTLTENIYYSIVARDVRDNVSPFSDKILIKKPDTIPPSSPVFKDYKVLDKSIVLKWSPSSSKDVVRQELYRRKGEGESVLIASFDPMTGTYKDTLLSASTMYSYHIAAIDDSGLYSYSPSELKIKSPYKLGMKNGALEIKYGKKQTIISYNIETQNENLDYVVIFRSQNGEKYKRWKMSKKTTDKFSDTQDSDKKNRYKAYTYFKNGLKSKLLTYEK